MPIYLVRLEHTDEDLWQRWIEPHVAWLNERVADGAVLASGPTVGTPIRTGVLVMRAADEAQLREVLSSDPFWDHGVVADHAVTRWNPLFGAFNAESSMPGPVDPERMR